MLPLLGPGDEVLCDPRGPFRPGDIVIARHPHRQNVRLVKRLRAYDGDGRAVLEGANPAESTDSRTLGAVPRRLLLGRVTSRFGRSAGEP